MLYVSYSTGYKSGGVNQTPDRPINVAGQELAGFDEEENQAFELGLSNLKGRQVEPGVHTLV